MQWWKQLKRYTNHNSINEFWQYFNVMQWWNEFGWEHYPCIMMVAAINLARPYSNEQQECDFSMATWFDGKLVAEAQDIGDVACWISLKVGC